MSSQLQEKTEKAPSKGEYMKQIADEIHKPVRKVKQRRTVRVSRPNEIWSMDLADMQEWKAENDGERYILTIVDVFTRYAWAVPMKSKTAIDTFAAFISVVDSSKRQPERIWVDQGAEFYNSVFKKWMKAQDPPVTMYSTFGESKSVIVERFNRTLKTKMWYFFTKENTRRWIDELPALLMWYNKRVHSKLGMSPWEASKVKNREKVFAIQNPVSRLSNGEIDKSGVKRTPRYSLGDSVRVSRIKGTFEKGFTPNWSREVFTIVGIDIPFDVLEPITYELRDRAGETLKGSFYEGELNGVKYPDVLLVESVLKEKKIKGEKHLLVKWLGYSEKMNSWIPESQVLDFLGKPKYEVVSASESKIKLKRI